MEKKIEQGEDVVDLSCFSISSFNSFLCCWATSTFYFYLKNLLFHLQLIYMPKRFHVCIFFWPSSSPPLRRITVYLYCTKDLPKKQALLRIISSWSMVALLSMKKARKFFLHWWQMQVSAKQGYIWAALSVGGGKCICTRFWPSWVNPWNGRGEINISAV